MAVFGLGIIISTSTFWWNAENKFDEFLESNINFLYHATENNEAYEKFIKKVNEGIAIYNSVGGDKNLFTDQQKNDFDAIMNEAEKLQKPANESVNPDPVKRIILNSRREKYEVAKWLSITAISIGVIISFLGFYLWHTRLQKYIDEEHKNKHA